MAVIMLASGSLVACIAALRQLVAIETFHFGLLVQLIAKLRYYGTMDIIVRIHVALSVLSIAERLEIETKTSSNCKYTELSDLYAATDREMKRSKHRKRHPSFKSSQLMFVPDSTRNTFQDPALILTVLFINLCQYGYA